MLGWWGWFDPVYFLFLLPGLVLALWAQWRVRSAYAVASGVPAHGGHSGAEAAHLLLRYAGVPGVEVEPTQGFLSDHYDPGDKVLRLSPGVYAGRSLAALGIAAHESGHAMQQASGYPLLALRNFLVPAAGLGSNLAWIILMAGFGLASLHLFYAAKGLILIGIVAFSLTVLFQLVNLPVEFNASRRAREALLDAGLVSADEDVVVKRVLDAAALTYVAATITALLTLLYLLFRSGLLGGRRN
jgi:uncharacterized protein